MILRLLILLTADKSAILIDSQKQIGDIIGFKREIS